MSDRKLPLVVCLIATAALLSGCVVYGTIENPQVAHPVPPPPPAPPPVGVDITFFYDSLRPDGDWLRLDPYGWVWAPNAVTPFWRPYTVGHWELTDWGWTWISSEPWGWATYHYGRWVRDHRHGWVWIPGNVWGPSWVAWRNGPGIVGWAPLPPEVQFHAGIGLDWGGIDVNVAIGLDSWCFVDDVRFTDHDIRRYAYPVGSNTTVIRGTHGGSHLRVDGGRIVDEGVDRGEIERAMHRAIPMRRLVDNPGLDRRTAEAVGDEVRVFRPEVRKGPSEPAPRVDRPTTPTPPSQAKAIDEEAVRRWDRGWSQDWDKLEKVRPRCRRRY
jgi:hypothetical protein